MDDTMIRCLKRIDDNFGTVEINQAGIWKAIKRNSRKIHGMKGLIIGLGIGMAVLAAELMERKRSENYLNERIDKLENKVADVEKFLNDTGKEVCNLGQELYEHEDIDHDGGVCDA